MRFYDNLSESNGDFSGANSGMNLKLWRSPDLSGENPVSKSIKGPYYVFFHSCMSFGKYKLSPEYWVVVPLGNTCKWVPPEGFRTHFHDRLLRSNCATTQTTMPVGKNKKVVPLPWLNFLAALLTSLGHFPSILRTISLWTIWRRQLWRKTHRRLRSPRAIWHYGRSVGFLIWKFSPIYSPTWRSTWRHPL